MGIIYRNGIPYAGTGKAARFFAATGDGAIDGSSATLKSIAEKAGDIYICQTAGTLYGISFKIGDAIIFKNAVVAGTAPTSSDFAVNKGTDSDTTYSAGTGLSLSGTTLNHSNSVTAGTASGDNSKTLSFGGTFTIPSVTYDSQGHITSSGITTMTMPGNPNSDTKVTNTLSTTTKAYVTGTSSSTTNTGTQFFDTGVYLTSTAGELAATTFSGKLKGTIDSSTTATTQTQGNNSTKIATTAYVDTAISDLPSPMVFKGSLGTGGTITALPVDGTATVGDTYKVIVAGTYASQAAKVGDMFICDSKTSSANTWTYIPSADDTNIIPSAYCDTAGDVDYKFAQCTDYTLLSKSYIQLILKNSNTSTSKLYLAIGSNGLQSFKPVYINGSVSSSSNYTLPAGTYLVYYDGTNYYLRTDGKITSTGIVDTSNTELYTNNTGTVTGTGTSAKLAKWNGTNSITSGPGITDNSSSTAVTSTDTNLITGRTLYYAGYTKNTGTVTGTGTSGYLTKWNTSNGITNGPQLSSSISSQTQSTKFLREDGTWSAPSYTTNTDIVPCAYCDTAAGTAAKTATCTGYTLTSNTYLHVLIKNTNTKASALTLSVNGQTAKTIYINGTTTSSSNYTLPAGTYIVYYDGTNYHFRTDGRIPGEANAAYRLNLQAADSYDANYPIAFGTSASGQALVGTDSGFTFNPTGNKIRGVNMITSTNTGSDEFSIGGGGGGLTLNSTTSTLIPAKDLQIHATAGSISIMGKAWGGGTGTSAVVNTSGYLIKNTSSIRYKNNVDYEINRQEYHNQLMQLKPCTFEYKVQPGETQLGLIAEDVAEINPDIPNYDLEGLPESLKDRDLTTLLIIEAQEKDKEIAALKEDIEDLKQRLSAIEDIIN